MTPFKLVGALCAATLMTAGTAVAAPMAHQDLGASAPASTIAMTMKGTHAGRMKQRQRTRTTRCDDIPSRG